MYILIPYPSIHHYTVEISLYHLQDAYLDGFHKLK